MDNESDLPHCFALKSKRNSIICNQSKAKRQVQLMSRLDLFVCFFGGECMLLVLHTEAKPSAVCAVALGRDGSGTVAEVRQYYRPVSLSAAVP